MTNSVNEIFVNAGIKYFVIMPDSMNSKLLKCVQENSHINIIQGLNETDVITITSGLNLTGTLSVAVFENSGIRSICDIITRFELSHHIHNIYLLSSRGELGEENWWGIMHKKVTSNILEELNILYTNVNCIQEFEIELSKAIRSFKTEQISVALNLTPSFYNSIQK